MTVEDVLDDVAEMLDIERASLDPDDNLLLEGLDSLRAMMLADGWAMAGAKIDVVDLFEQPTANGMFQAMKRSIDVQ